jgi:hypothetical protein
VPQRAANSLTTGGTRWMSGKTTQIAQMLLKAGVTQGRMIGVTQPRRVAAVTVARWALHEVPVGKFRGNRAPRAP